MIAYANFWLQPPQRNTVTEMCRRQAMPMFLSKLAAIAVAPALLLATLFASPPARSQGASPDVVAAYREFHSGKAEGAIGHLKTIIAGLAAPRARVPLERDLIEICATAYEWQCVDE